MVDLRPQEIRRAPVGRVERSRTDDLVVEAQIAEPALVFAAAAEVAEEAARVGVLLAQGDHLHHVPGVRRGLAVVAVGDEAGLGAVAELAQDARDVSRDRSGGGAAPGGAQDRNGPAALAARGDEPAPSGA